MKENKQGEGRMKGREMEEGKEKREGGKVNEIHHSCTLSRHTHIHAHMRTH